MNDTHDLDRRMADYYATEAPSRAPNWLLTQALDTIDTTPQRRTVLGRSWRVPTMPSPLAKLAVSTVAIAAVGFVGLTLLQGPVAGPAASPAASPSPSSTASTEPASPGSMWPQSNLDEVREAQELADAGKPRYTWQIDPTLGHDAWRGPYHAEIFARFVEDKLGWEEYLAMGGRYPADDVWYIRCAPGGTNPVYPDDLKGGGCAPTIDEYRYETVQIEATQPGFEGPSAIWVVTGWKMLEPFAQADPRVAESEGRALAEAFMQARIAGEGAEQHVDARAVTGDDIPFLYATSAGAPYERSELEVVDVLWPDGRTRVKVRLFAADGKTVVEQFFRLARPELGLWYEDETGGPDGSVGPGTTVNGRVGPVPYSLFGGEVTLDLTYPWIGFEQDSTFELHSDEFEGVLTLGGGPGWIGCLEGLAQAAAQALAQAIRSDPNLDATAPVAVSVGGIPALQMDVSTTVACADGGAPGVAGVGVLPGHRVRLYLVDLPQGSSPRVLTIAIGAAEESFERLVESAAPIVDSIEFHAP